MANYKKIDFNGIYKLFYPESGLEDTDKKAITIVAKNLFGEHTKVYFTDDEPELLEEVLENVITTRNDVAPTATNVVPKVVPTVNIELQRRLLEEDKRAEGYHGRKDYMKINKMGEFAKDPNIGRDPNWI